MALLVSRGQTAIFLQGVYRPVKKIAVWPRETIWHHDGLNDLDGIVWCDIALADIMVEKLLSVA